MSRESEQTIQLNIKRYFEIIEKHVPWYDVTDHRLLIKKAAQWAAFLLRCCRLRCPLIPMIGFGFVAANSALAAVLEGIIGHGVALDVGTLVIPEKVKGLG